MPLVNGFHDVADWHRQVETFHLMGARFRVGMTVELVTESSHYWITRTVHAEASVDDTVKGFALQTDSRTLQHFASISPLELRMSSYVTPHQPFLIGYGHTGAVQYLRVL